MKNLAFDDNGDLISPTDEEVTRCHEEGERLFNALFPDRNSADPEDIDTDPAPEVEPADVVPADLDTLGDIDPADLGSYDDFLAVNAY